MNKFKKIAAITKRAALNSVRIKNQSIIMAIICFAGAFLILFSVLLFNCAILLKNLTNLPYMDHYLFYGTDKNANPPVIDKNVILYGDYAIFTLEKFEIVEEIIGSSRYYQNTDLKYISTKNEVSDKTGKFNWTVIPNSEYDDSFVRGERIIVSGRHVTIEDYRNKTNCVIIDEVLAKANGVKVGSEIKTNEDETFKIVGIYKTLKTEKNIETYADIPQNLIIASNQPETAEIITYGTYDVYLKFNDGVSEATKKDFFEYIASLGITGEDRFNRYSFISVEELNKINNSGITTVFNIAAVSMAAVFMIIAASVYIFINIILNSRRREILLYKALGEKRRNVIASFLLEIAYVAVPSIILGIAACHLLCRDYIRDLFVHFASQMSPENLRSTSSVAIKTVQNTGKLVEHYTSAQNIPQIFAGIFIVLLLIAGVCLAAQLSALLNKKTITLLTERKY